MPWVRFVRLSGRWVSTAIGDNIMYHGRPGTGLSLSRGLGRRPSGNNLIPTLLSSEESSILLKHIPIPSCRSSPPAWTHKTRSPPHTPADHPRIGNVSRGCVCARSLVRWPMCSPTFFFFFFRPRHPPPLSRHYPRATIFHLTVCAMRRPIPTRRNTAEVANEYSQKLGSFVCSQLWK